MYKKGPRNVHVDALSRLQMLAETTAGECDETLSFLLIKKFSEHTRINYVHNAAVRHKLRYKHNRRNCQLQHDNDARGDSPCPDDAAPEELFATLPVLMAADPLFEPN